jgi:uncharacterized protein (DUF3084 family)
VRPYDTRKAPTLQDDIHGALRAFMRRKFLKSKEQQEIQREKDRLRKRNYTIEEREKLMKELEPEIQRLRAEKQARNSIIKDLELKLALELPGIKARRELDKARNTFDTSSLLEKVTVNLETRSEKVETIKQEKADFLDELMKRFEENKPK